MKIPARLFILFMGAIAALPAMAQPIDTLRTLKPVSDSKLNAINQTVVSQEAELKQLKKQDAILLAEKKKLETDRQGLEIKLVVLQKELGEQQKKAQATEDELQQQLQQAQAGLAAAAGQLKESEKRLRKAGDEKTALVRQLDILTSKNISLMAQLEKQDVSGIENVIKSWTKAWSEQNVEDYLSFYSPDFHPSGARSRFAWENLRRSRLTHPKFIIVSLRDIKIDSVDSTSTRVNFIQSYKSNRYTDTVTKQLEMKKENGGWKILSEKEVE
ncbi:MAG: hypothetical protein GQ578_11085 [Desulfuromonadaceae bacterium]|nr:hypothetical protein [Desulfuromonadaceae bacterium]